MADINSLSPDFRDFLLNRNIVSDTVSDNGVYGLLEGIGKPKVFVGTPPESVQSSKDIEEIGEDIRNSSIVNQFTGQDGVREVNIEYKPKPIQTQSGTYDLSDSNLISGNESFLNSNVLKNRYQDEQGRFLVDINFSPTIISDAEPYLDATGEFTVGGPSTKVLDIVGSILSGKGVGFSPDGPEPNYDIRGTLAGRVLASGGLINDSQLGIIGAQQLTAHLGYNALFNLQEETIGRVNTNIVSILKGDNIIVPNYQITVAKNKLIKIVDYGAKVLGFEIPVSLLERDASIFNKENPVANILRAEQMYLNTGKGQVLALIDNLNQNKYRYKISDKRTKKGINQREDGTNEQIYAFSDGKGGVIDLLNTNVDLDDDGNIKDGEFDINSPMSQSNYKSFNSGFDKISEARGQEIISDDDGTAISLNNGAVGFSWGGGSGDDNIVTDNNIAREQIDNYDGLFKNPNSLLSKTKRLFDSGKMRTLVSGKGVKVGALTTSDIGNINSGTKGLMSKGSGVLSSKHNERKGTSAPADTFCRTWTNFDRYNQVINLQKNRDLDRNLDTDKSNAHLSVLDDNGFVKISPYKNDKSEIKKFMFSIENLAWNDDLIYLPKCEIGNGDLLTGAKGRIMWFPPYEMSFTDNSTVNWESNTFMGRGEPVYTYNNTERKGTLQWKIIVDHNSYMNEMAQSGPSSKELDNEIITFIAGCSEKELELIGKLSDEEIRQIAVSEKQDEITSEDPAPFGPIPPFNMYFPNDSATIPDTYEDGIEISDGTTTGEGYVAKYRSCEKWGEKYLGNYTDTSDFGFNSSASTWVWDSKTYNGYHGIKSDTSGLSKLLLKDCKGCTVEVIGYVSNQVDEFKSYCESKGLDIEARKAENQENQTELAQARADFGKEFILGIISSDKNASSRVTSKVIVANIDDQDTTQEGQEVKDHKKARTTQIIITYDAEKAQKLGEENTVVTTVQPEDKIVNKEIIARFYTECDYFEKLKQNDKVVYDSISAKLKHFAPAFHSTTPEGFNSRLTFLKQCTRQGPTKNPNSNANNLAFGRPPVCILRVGDFYHTKIVIDNVSLSFDPLVWDLNPEGIGVQPMIATVDMSFSFIGGSSLAGPINRLQNAVSFNYFANTELYDDRADRIKVGKDGGGVLVDGTVNKPQQNATDTAEADKDSTSDGGTKPTKDQEENAEDETTKEEEGNEEEGVDIESEREYYKGLNITTDWNEDGNLTVNVHNYEGFDGWTMITKLSENKSPYDLFAMTNTELKNENVNESGNIIIIDEFTTKETIVNNIVTTKNDIECWEGTKIIDIEQITLYIDFIKEGVETVRTSRISYLSPCSDSDEYRDIVLTKDTAIYRAFDCECP